MSDEDREYFEQYAFLIVAIGALNFLATAACIAYMIFHK